jgi:hypothetical protein
MAGAFIVLALTVLKKRRRPATLPSDKHGWGMERPFEAVAWEYSPLVLMSS